MIAEEVPHILETLKARKFDYALFKIVRDYEDRGLGVSEDMAEKLKVEIDALSRAGKIDHKFTNLDKIFAYQKPYDNAGICHINKMGLLTAITPEGDVYPNISEIGRDEFKTGNLNDQSFEEIWHGKLHEKVKTASEKLWKSGHCKNCRAISYNLRINEMILNLPQEEDPFL